MDILLEVGKNVLPGLTDLDVLFTDLKKTEKSTDEAKIKIKIEKLLTKIFSTPFELDIHHLGDLSYNCAVMPILKSNGKIEKGEDFVKLGNIKKVYIILGTNLLKDITPREMTAIILHEIGHIVNHIGESLSSLRYFSHKTSYILSVLNHVPVLNAVILPLYIISSRTLYFTSHVGEYNADKFAAEYGYGDELISVIHKWDLEESKYNSQKNFTSYLSQLKYFILGKSHPDDKDRIKELAEEIKKNYSNKYKSKKLENILNEYY